ncbi:biotin transporter BioY [Ostreiculturibacter nitratireducens]|uniref:biotin transporter BioY n=1 Tax=Ostreiculturibacter nitratireducens TaxID=3075226 RepID=UPI0031B64456
MTLSHALLPSQSLVTRILMVVGGSFLIALSAQIKVPMIPVPMTLQTLAILFVGLTFGARMGALTVAAYLAEGAAGLPVFAGGATGAALVGPTAGFLFGFVAMAYLAGLAADRGVKGLVPTLLVALAVSALLYMPGVYWLATFIGFEKAVVAGMMPFLVGDAVKAAIAALVVTGGWSFVKSRKS